MCWLSGHLSRPESGLLPMSRRKAAELTCRYECVICMFLFLGLGICICLRYVDVNLYRCMHWPNHMHIGKHMKVFKRVFCVAIHKDVFKGTSSSARNLVETATRPQPIEIVVWDFILHANGAIWCNVMLCDPSRSQTTINNRLSAHAPGWRARVLGRRCMARSLH